MIDFVDRFGVVLKSFDLYATTDKKENYNYKLISFSTSPASNFKVFTYCNTFFGITIY